ncbi:MAG: VTT domain-containing protein [Leptospirales bacterium]|nr:VTT domain-containing protein [Leptospirales bacterium]
MKFIRKPEKRDWLSICIILALLGLFIWVGFKYYSIYEELKGDGFIATAKNLQEAILSYGNAGLLVIVFLHSLHVIISVIPAALIQFAGGLIYGIPIGMAVGIIGVAAGTAVSFCLSRFLGRRILTLFMSDKTIDKMDSLISNDMSTIALLILFIIPFPKDFIAYFIGLTNMGAFRFFMISAIGRLPGMFIATYLGANVIDNNLTLTIIVGSITLIALLFFYFFKDRVLDFVSARRNFYTRGD